MTLYAHISCWQSGDGSQQCVCEKPVWFILKLTVYGGRLVRYFMWLYVKFHFCRITHVQMCLLLTLPFPNHFQNILLAKCCAEKPKAYNK